MILKVIFFILLFQAPKILYSFYNFYGDIPFQYQITFTGDLIIDSKFINYTNTGEFDITYTLQTRSEFSTPQQSVTDWYFSELHTTTFPPLLSTLWRNYLLQKQKEIAYAVRVNNNHFLVFNKKGEVHPLSYIMEVFFPVIKQNKLSYKQNYHIPHEYSSVKKQNFLNINIEGWDFFKYTRPLTDKPLILLETNTQFINQIYSNYVDNRKNKQSTLFWIQSLNISQQNIYKQIESNIELTGMYFIDLAERLLHHATIIGKMTIPVSYEHQNYQTSINIELEGKFNIKLIYPSVYSDKDIPPPIMLNDNLIPLGTPKASFNQKTN